MGNYIKSTPAFSGGTVSGNTEFVGDLSGATFYSGSTPLTQIIENLIPTGNTLPSGDYGQVQFNENGVFVQLGKYHKESFLHKPHSIQVSIHLHKKMNGLFQKPVF